MGFISPSMINIIQSRSQNTAYTWKMQRIIIWKIYLNIKYLNKATHSER